MFVLFGGDSGVFYLLGFFQECEIDSMVLDLVHQLSNTLSWLK